MKLLHSTGQALVRRRMTAVLLSIALLFAVIPPGAYAAEEVTAVEFEFVPSPFKLYVEDETYSLKVLATISGISAKRDVTADATWSSSNAQAVKVEKGLLTALSSGTAQITAKYQGITALTTVTAEYLYDKVVLLDGATGVAAPNKMDVLLDEEISFDLSAYEGTNESDVTTEAVWSTSSTAVATVSKGIITLTGTGSATITAKYKGRSDSIILNVTSPYQSITLTPSGLMELNVGDDDGQLTAIGHFKTGLTAVITEDADWKSSSAAIATVEKGVVTAVAPGTATITATHLGATKSVTVVVRLPHQAMKLDKDKEIHMLVTGAPFQITATVYDSNPDVGQDVTSQAEWTSSNVYAATVTNGLVSPKAAGTTKITASYKGLKREITLTVYPTISKLEIGKEELDGFIDSTEALPTVTGTTIGDETQDVTKLVKWSTSNSSIVAIEDGKWIGKKVGKATLTATVNSRSVSVDVIIHEKPLILLTDIENLSIVTGQETDLPKITVVYENGEEEDITAKAVWKASSANLLVKSDGLKGLVTSKVNLTATFLGKSVTVRVTIEEEVVKLTADPIKVELTLNKSKTIKVTGTYKNGKTVSLGSKMNWTVGTEGIVSLKNSTVKSLKEGTTKLIGTYQDKTVEVTVIVQAKLKKLVLSEKSFQLSPGKTASLVATAEYEGNKALQVTSSAVWTSSKSTVATVSSSGVVTAVAKGTATIKATYEGKSVSLRVTVK